MNIPSLDWIKVNLYLSELWVEPTPLQLTLNGDGSLTAESEIKVEAAIASLGCFTPQSEYQMAAMLIWYAYDNILAESSGISSMSLGDKSVSYATGEKKKNKYAKLLNCAFGNNQGGAGIFTSNKTGRYGYCRYLS